MAIFCIKNNYNDVTNNDFICLYICTNFTETNVLNKEISMKIRNATPDDAKTICDIYNYYIVNTAVTFEIDALTVEEVKQRIAEDVNSGFPYFVAEVDGKIIGYCYSHLWNKRRAYSNTHEVSIYLDVHETGKGYGSMLLKNLLENIDRAKVHTFVAGITIPNEESIRLHEKFGFKQVSYFKEVGRKFDRWHDVGHWQLILKPAITVKSVSSAFYF